MITVSFTYAAKELEDGRHVVHLYLNRKNDGGVDLSPRAEQKALDDAEIIIRDIVQENDPDDESRLLQKGQPSDDEFIVARFHISVRWDRKLKMATYHRAGYERLQWSGIWQPVASLMMEQYDYTMSVLRKREKAERKAKSK